MKKPDTQNTRRSFLRKAVLGTAAVSSAPVLLSGSYKERLILGSRTYEDKIFSANDQIYYLAVFFISRSAHQMMVFLIKKEVVKIIIEFNSSYSKLALNGDAFPQFVIMYQTRINRFSILVIGYLPNLFNIF